MHTIHLGGPQMCVCGGGGAGWHIFYTNSSLFNLFKYFQNEHNNIVILLYFGDNSGIHGTTPVKAIMRLII